MLFIGVVSVQRVVCEESSEKKGEDGSSKIDYVEIMKKVK